MSTYFTNRSRTRLPLFVKIPLAIIGLFFLCVLIGGAAGTLGGESTDDAAEVTAGGQVFVDVLANDHIEGDRTVRVESSPEGVWVSVTDDGLLIDVSDYRGTGDFSVQYSADGTDAKTGEREHGLGWVEVHVNPKTGTEVPACRSDSCSP